MNSTTFNTTSSNHSHTHIPERTEPKISENLKEKIAKAKLIAESLQERIPPIESFQYAGFVAISQKIADADILINFNKGIHELFPDFNPPGSKSFDFAAVKKVLTPTMEGFKLVLSPLNILYNLTRIGKQGQHILRTKEPLNKIKHGFTIIAALGEMCESTGTLGSGLQYFNVIQNSAWITPLTGVGIGLSVAGIIANSIGAYQSCKALKKVDAEKNPSQKLRVFTTVSKSIFGINKSLKQKVNTEINRTLNTNAIGTIYERAHKNAVNSLIKTLKGRVQDHIKESSIFILAAVISIIGTSLLIFAPPIGALIGTVILVASISLTIFNTVMVVRRNKALDNYLKDYSIKAFGPVSK